MTHGRYTTYANLRCRCGPCRADWRRYTAERRESRRKAVAAGEVVPVHGRNSTYLNYGCRCSECREAHTVAARTHREAAR